MTQANRSFQKIVQTLKIMAGSLNPTTSRPDYSNQLPGGPFAAAPGPAQLALGTTPSGAVHDVFLNAGDQVALFGRHSSGAGQLQDSLVAQQIARKGAYVLLDTTLDKDRQDMLAYLHGKAGTSRSYHVLNPDDPSRSHTYNPLASGTAPQAAFRLVRAMMGPRHGEAPMGNAERSAVLAMLTGLIEALRERDGTATLAKLHAVLTDVQAFSALVESPALWGRTRAALAYCFANCRRPGEASYDIGAIQAPLARLLELLPSFVTGKMGEVVNQGKADVDLETILSSGQGLFVMLPVLGKDPTALTFGRLVLEDLTDTLLDMAPLLAAPGSPPALIVTVETPAVSTGRLDGLLAGVSSNQAILAMCACAATGVGYRHDVDHDAFMRGCATKVFFRAAERESAADLRQLGQSLAHAGASAQLPAVLEKLGTVPRGTGVVVRDGALSTVQVWPAVVAQEGIKPFEVLRND